MRIFSDRHHQSLAHSLKMLFEDRLKMELYFPIGMEWFPDYWKINSLEATAKQFLELGSFPSDGTMPLNEGEKKDNIYFIQDPHNHSIQKAITLDTFKNIKFDILIASIPAHIKPFKELIDKYQPQAKLIFQMGNHFNEVDDLLRSGEIKNLMSSTAPFNTYSANSVFYHQEFDLEVFKPSSKPVEKMITSFINVLNQNGGMQNYYTLKASMPDYRFFSYGGQCEDGGVVGVENMARIMGESAFGFMCKSGADGYGHNLHNFFAVGTPVIINYEEYKDKLGGLLTIPDETCIIANIGDDMQAVAEKIRNISPIQYEWMRSRTYERFKEIVDFDKEQKDIEKFLERLI
ncbi:hypothetical protein M0R04_14235 [Candidatus Dojkabacteria bacterium]|jgi:hypothetical protein|nr:hypothetical protein [Candidatus Dojkabacteria bacterium]